MDKLLSKAVGLSALLLGMSLGLSSPAEACSPGWCEQPQLHLPLPAGNRDVPVNLPALVLQARCCDIPTEGEGRPRLVRVDGLPIPTRLERQGRYSQEYLLMPQAPLVPGERYALGASCQGRQSGTSLWVSFTTSPVRQLPETSGQLELMEQGQGMLQVGHGASCLNPAEVRYARLRFVPSPELVPFLPWVEWRLEVDGKRWTTAALGALGADGSFLDPAPSSDPYQGRTIFQVHTLCDTTALGSDPGVTPGPHRLALYPTLMMSPPRALPPAALDIELRCATSEPSPQPSPQPSPEPPAEPPAPHPPWGCSQAGGGSALAVTGLSALALLRRRRGRAR